MTNNEIVLMSKSEPKKFSFLSTCAAETVFCYTAENNHHLKAWITSKNRQFQEEKISARKRARSHVNMEKSSKTLFLCLGKSPLEGYPSHPLPQRIENLRNLHMEKARLQDAEAKSRHGIGTQRNGERGENNAELNNSSTVQHFDAGFQMKIVKTISFWRRWQANIASYIVRAESIKGSPS